LEGDLEPDFELFDLLDSDLFLDRFFPFFDLSLLDRLRDLLFEGDLDLEGDLPFLQFLWMWPFSPHL